MKGKIGGLLFLISTVLGIFTFYGLGFNFISQLIYVYLSKERKQSWVISTIISLVVVFMFWWPVFSVQLSGGQFIKSNLAGWSAISGALSLKSLLMIPIKFTVGRINLSAGFFYQLISAITMFYMVSLIAVSLTKVRVKWIYLWLFIPLLIASMLSIFTPMLGYWRYIFVLPGFVSLIAIGINSFPKPFSTLNLVTTVGTFILLNSLFWLNPHFQREDWPSALQYASGPDSVIVFAFSDVFAPASWYAPNLEYIHPFVNLSQTPDDFDALLSQSTLGKKNIYVFDYLSGLTDPHHNINNWFANAGFTNTDSKDFRGVGLVHHYQP
jgi:hypothetical protein